MNNTHINAPSLGFLNGKDTGRFAFIICFICLILFMIGGFVNIAHRGMVADDDNLWLYYNSQKIAALAEGNALETDIIETAKAAGAGVESETRLVLRRDYTANYLVPVLVWHAASRVYPAPAEVAKFPEYLSHFVPGMFVLTAALPWLLLIAVLVYLRDFRVTLGVALAVGLMAVWLFIPNPIPSSFIVSQNGWMFWGNMAYFFVNPWHPFSPFGFTPRNNLVVALIAVFALRYAGHYRAAYMVLLAFFFWHTSQALLVALIIFGLDALLRRERLRDPVLLGGLAFGLVYALLRETLWANVASTPILWAGGVVGLLLVAAVLYWIYAPTPVWLIRHPVVARVNAHMPKSPPIADFIVFMVPWFVSLFFITKVVGGFSEMQKVYFWFQLHGRTLGVLWPALLAGVMMCAVSKENVRTLLAVLLVMVGSFVLAQVAYSRKQPDLNEQFQASAESYHKALNGEVPVADLPPYGANGVLPETIGYYALGLSLTYGESQLPQYYKLIRPRN